MLTPVQEIYFWSGIMRDHAEMQLNAFSFKETQFIMSSQYFKNAFMQLVDEAEKLCTDAEGPLIIELVNRTIPVLLQFIDYKRLLVRKLLECNIELGLSPTFINHMINEAMEFYRALCMTKPVHPINTTAENIHLHMIWLPDAAGHAASIASDLDPTEVSLIKEADEFKNTFEHLFVKATELGLMLERTCLCDGSLIRLNEQAEKYIKNFICYLNKVLDLRLKCKVMGVIKPFIPDHMIREEQYYMTKLQEFMKK